MMPSVLSCCIYNVLFVSVPLTIAVESYAQMFVFFNKKCSRNIIRNKLMKVLNILKNKYDCFSFQWIKFN